MGEERYLVFTHHPLFEEVIAIPPVAASREADKGVELKETRLFCAEARRAKKKAWREVEQSALRLHALGLGEQEA